jgi:uncharacterized Rmd1/YagE family protein
MRIPLKAWYFISTVDEKIVRKRLSEFTVEFEDPLVIKINENHHAVITSFGAVVFWPFDEDVARLVSSRIQETLANPQLVEDVEDRLFVETDKEGVRFFNNEIWLPSDYTPTQMRIIAMLLAQSVALDYLDREADRALEALSPHIGDLSRTGNIKISNRKILKNIGFAMQTRQAVLTNLALFDKPAETWESDDIEDFYQGLHDFFDIPERQEVLNVKLDFLSEITRILFEVLSSRKSHNLEIIVILLIALELVAFGLFEAVR